MGMRGEGEWEGGEVEGRTRWRGRARPLYSIVHLLRF